MNYLSKIDINKIPQHVAIIMDGNGRWAKQRGKERYEGHIAGAETVNEIIEATAQLSISYLTLYTFSTENWKRPAEEVKALMNLILNSIDEEKLISNNIRFRTIGQSNRLPRELYERLQQAINHTIHNTGLTLVLALDYSARWEISQMANLIAQEVKTGSLQPEMIDEACVQSHMSTHDMPNPDLLIRTGGEYRISNFLLWQCAYTELYFCDIYWPDFKKKDFYEAIYNFQHRERRFGMTSEQI